MKKKRVNLPLLVYFCRVNLIRDVGLVNKKSLLRRERERERDDLAAARGSRRSIVRVVKLSFSLGRRKRPSCDTRSRNKFRARNYGGIYTSRAALNRASVSFRLIRLSETSRAATWRSEASRAEPRDRFIASHVRDVP